MELILATTPDFFVEEDKIITSLFDEGLDMLHLRKPVSEPIYAERLLTLLPSTYYKQIVVHDHFYLKEEFGLKGIQINKRNPEPPAGYKGYISRSCHSMEELAQYKKTVDNVILSPVYDSISKWGRKAAFTREELTDAARKGWIDKQVFAQGGVSLEHIHELESYGFGGVVILGDIWNRFKVHSNIDFKELISYFKKLRKEIK
jgi:thiamine-phosphate pyrophosphorylase